MDSTSASTASLPPYVPTSTSRLRGAYAASSPSAPGGARRGAAPICSSANPKIVFRLFGVRIDGILTYLYQRRTGTGLLEAPRARAAEEAVRVPVASLLVPHLLLCEIAGDDRTERSRQGRVASRGACAMAAARAPSDSLRFVLRCGLTLGSIFTGAGVAHAVLQPDLVRERARTPRAGVSHALTCQRPPKCADTARLEQGAHDGGGATPAGRRIRAVRHLHRTEARDGLQGGPIRPRLLSGRRQQEVRRKNLLFMRRLLSLDLNVLKAVVAHGHTPDTSAEAPEASSASHLLPSHLAQSG